MVVITLIGGDVRTASARRVSLNIATMALRYTRVITADEVVLRTARADEELSTHNSDALRPFQPHNICLAKRLINRYSSAANSARNWRA